MKWFAALVLVLAVSVSAGEYDRRSWRHWTDADRDGMNTRHEVLFEESSHGTRVRAGKVVDGHWVCPFSGEVITDPSRLDVDHLVPLANAHRSGASRWSKRKKRAYANYVAEPSHLIAVVARWNRQKGAKGPDAWKPPKREAWCEYAIEWTRVKGAWGLSMTDAEQDAVIEMVATCQSQTWDLRE